MVAAAPRSSGGLAAQGRAGLRHQSPERVETRCWCLSDAWGWPSLAKTAHSSERSRTHCAVGGTERPVPHAKCLGVLLWGPEAAGLQWAPWPAPEAGPGAARRGVLSRGRSEQMDPTPPVWGRTVCTAFPELGPSAPLLFPKEGGSQPAVA